MRRLLFRPCSVGYQKATNACCQPIRWDTQVTCQMCALRRGKQCSRLQLLVAHRGQALPSQERIIVQQEGGLGEMRV